ncbi:MAG: hypothetical protein H7Y00_16280 [Fimbriimonadaceae bacterium]|nr:hypothetical protein [Chitinophagales bacterium]
MNKQKKFSKKLLQYSSLASALILSTDITEAQTNSIIYADLDPDEMFVKDTSWFPAENWWAYSMDMDENGVVDFRFNASMSTPHSTISTYWNFSSVSMGLWASDSNFIMGSFDIVNYPYVLNYGDIINTEKSWQNYFGHLAFVSHKVNVEGGNWLDADTNKYVGLKFLIGSEYHYGWARLDVAYDGIFIKVKDYAYNTIAGEGLFAGQLTSVSAEDISENATINIYTSANMIYVSAQGLSTKNNILKIANASGQIIYNEVLNEPQTQITLDNGAFYLLYIIADDKMYLRKIIL